MQCFMLLDYRCLLKMQILVTQFNPNHTYILLIWFVISALCSYDGL